MKPPTRRTVFICCSCCCCCSGSGSRSPAIGSTGRGKAGRLAGRLRVWPAGCTVDRLETSRLKLEKLFSVSCNQIIGFSFRVVFVLMRLPPPRSARCRSLSIYLSSLPIDQQAAQSGLQIHLFHQLELTWARHQRLAFSPILPPLSPATQHQLVAQPKPVN